MTNHIIDLGKLSEPLTKLVETVAAGIGGLYAPMGVVRRAKADAKAAIIRAEAEGQVASIEQRVKHRLEYIEALRQENIERIVTQAASEMPESVSHEQVSQDWTLQFITVAQDVCDEDLQRIWARILAGEVTKPGTFSKRTIEFLKTLSKEEAEYFTILSGFAFLDQNSWPILVLSKASFSSINESVPGVDLIHHFESIGLLSGSQVLYRSHAMSGHYRYFDKTVKFTGPDQPKPFSGKLEYFIEIRSYTAIGSELFRIAGAKPVADYVERLSESLQKDPVNLKLEFV